MKIMKLLSVSLTLFIYSLWGQISNQGVRITGTINDSLSTLFTGNIHVCWPQHTDSSGNGVIGACVRIPIVAGVIDIRLLPSLNGGPIGAFKYDLFGTNSALTATYSSSWVIPRTTATLDVSAVAQATSGGASLPSTSNILAGNGSGGAIPLPTPTLCSTGQAPTGITSTGAATGCAPITSSTYSNQLLDLHVGWTSATRLTVNGCAGGASCIVWDGQVPYTIAGNCTMDSDGVGSSNGTIFIYALKSDSSVHVGHTAGTPGTSTTCPHDDGVVTGPPTTGAISLATWSILNGNFPTEVPATNDKRPLLQFNSGQGLPQSYKQSFGFVTQSGGVTQSGDFWTNAGSVSGGKNGALLGMDNSAGSQVVVSQELLPSWDGTAPSLIINWYQSNGAPGGQSVRWDVSVQCRTSGTSTTAAFGTAASTLVAVPASNTWARSTISVPIVDSTHTCLAGEAMDIQIANSPSGTGTTYTGGNFFLSRVYIRIVQ